MLKKDIVLIVGSRPPPINGQSIAFDCAARALENENEYEIKEIHTLFRNNNIVSLVLVPFFYFYKVLYSRLIYRPKVVYFVCSRSLIGSMRDAFLILTYHFSGSKLVNHLHGSNFNEFIETLPYAYKKFLLFLYRRVDKYIVLQEGMKEQFFAIKNSKDKIVVIPNFYESIADHSDILIAKDAYNPMPISLIYLSAICTTKGIFDLIQSSILLSDNGIPHSLTIAGVGMHDSLLDSKTVMEKFHSEIKGISSINYIGIIRGKEKYKLLGKSHIFLLPTYYESEAIPLSIIEAMRMGCAIITTDHKYIPQLVENNMNGLLVQPMNAEDISKRVTYLYNNKSIFNTISAHNVTQSKNLYSETKYQANIIKHVNL